MRVELQISQSVTEPYAVVYANALTPEIKRTVSVLQQQESVVTALDERENIIILKQEELYMVRVEQAKTVVYCREGRYHTKKRLYEFVAPLNDFVQISKSAWINTNQLERVEPSFNGLMRIWLKNGLGEYISRKYLPAFKRTLGLGKGESK
ncbi:LytTR family DNA-binding domain-containing protein [Feifania hominis]|uniref:LytTR family transcriptional regulator n=1 Tax=Feifania hominis TaxID=2763660 RepID=A0A926DDU9_9FIRM|nr:LytTR family DNA-binding domain-containing protein [Feifania hominis]MBC8535499.1 LytTR family transcriptional regulator [Feifania hominis]